MDTPDKRLLRRSLERPLYREKLRVRSYGTVTDFDAPCFLEVKRKFDGTTYKRRAALSLRQAQYLMQAQRRCDSQMPPKNATVEWVPPGDAAEISSDWVLTPDDATADGMSPKDTIVDGMSTPRDKGASPSSIAAPGDQANTGDRLTAQILNELAWIIGREHPLEPALSIVYTRAAYFWKPESKSESAAPYGGGLRLTLDSNLGCKPGSWHDFLLPAQASGFQALLCADLCILELKADFALPLNLARMLNGMEIYPRSFSKVRQACTQVGMEPYMRLRQPRGPWPDIIALSTDRISG
jgi:hypothetical protein